MARLSKNMFSSTRPRKATPKGAAGFDNPRENIDPHIKTQAISTKEIKTDSISLKFGDIVSEQNPYNTEAIRLKATSSDVDVVIGDALGFFTVWNVTDERGADSVFDVDNDGNVNIAGDLTAVGNIGIGTTPTFGIHSVKDMSVTGETGSNFGPHSGGTGASIVVNKGANAGGAGGGDGGDVIITPGDGGGSPIVAGANGNIIFDGNAFPIATGEMDLGKATLLWRDLWMSGDARINGTVNAEALDVAANAEIGSLGGTSLILGNPNADLDYTITFTGDNRTATFIHRTSGDFEFDRSAGGFNFLTDVTFVGEGSGLPFAEIYARDNTATTSTSTTKAQILIFDTDGEFNNMTPDHAQDHITVIKAGRYKIDASISIKNSSGAAHVISLEMYKNNGTVVFNNIHAGRTLGTGSDVGNLTMSGIVDLAANDTIEMWITSDSAAARTVTVEDIDFCAIQIGGT